MRRFVLIGIAIIILGRPAFCYDWSILPTPSAKISSIETTPEGIAAGEFDDRMWLNPYNGVYFSEDGGNVWREIGLKGRGIKTLRYAENTLYAGVFYSGGLYISHFPYTEWIFSGLQDEITSVDSCGDFVYAGTKIRGLMVSSNNGLDWEQKLGSGAEGLEIVSLECSGQNILAATRTSVYFSDNYGNTWAEQEIFEGTTIHSFSSQKNIMIATGSGIRGFFISEDSGVTWEKVLIPVEEITKRCLLSGQRIFLSNNPEIVFTPNAEEMVENTGFSEVNNMQVMDMALFAPGENSEILVLNSSNKLYKSPINNFYNFPFLDAPFEISTSAELIENINSFFDHRYPLLAYPYFTESAKYDKSTLKYNGEEDSEPTTYYSSHSGIDFDMKYGDSVLAASSGTAHYYYCKDCGNTIKIDHGNGYQTTYMHLKNNTLVQDNNTLWVNKGDKIGEVGLTGRTTGPHLHFEVTSDKNKNGSFSDEFPQGRTDPFGWDLTNFFDPWSKLTWNDSLGFHVGSFSSNLWNGLHEEPKISFLTEGGVIQSGNKRVEVIENHEKPYYKIELEYAPKPAIMPPMLFSKYIKGTSFALKITDQLGMSVSLPATLKVELRINPEEIANTIPESIKLFRWLEELSAWEEVAGSFDPESGVLSAFLDHLSYFAAFGTTTDDREIHTFIVFNTSPEGWYFQNPPEITFETNGNITVFSLNGGDSWTEYKEPFTVTENSITEVLYKSDAKDGVWEETQSYIIKTGPEIKTTKISIQNAEFETSVNNPSP